MTQATDPFASALPIPTLLPTSSPKREVKWSYGITTVPERQDRLLYDTVKSLDRGGFGSPTVFVDGESRTEAYEKQLGLEVVCRPTRLGPFLNWVLALWELYGREPDADLYAVFQDDILVSRNLRTYLERTLLNGQGRTTRNGYYNLFTSVGCHDYWAKRLHRADTLPIPNGETLYTGWLASAQLGWGACALVFDREAVIRLLSDRSAVVSRPSGTAKSPRCGIDGAVADALTFRGKESAAYEDWLEWVHLPSLVQHVGETSTIGHARYSPAPSFRGEGFDLLSLLPKEGAAR